MGKTLIRENQETWPVVTSTLCPWQQKGLLTRAAEREGLSPVSRRSGSRRGSWQRRGKKKGGGGGKVGDVSAW